MCTSNVFLWNFQIINQAFCSYFASQLLGLQMTEVWQVVAATSVKPLGTAPPTLKIQNVGVSPLDGTRKPNHSLGFSNCFILVRVAVDLEQEDNLDETYFDRSLLMLHFICMWFCLAAVAEQFLNKVCLCPTCTFLNLMRHFYTP